MTDLENMLAKNSPPAPRASLSANILAEARKIEPANDQPARRPIWAMGGIAAMAIAAVLFFVQPAPDITETESAQWEQVADASGFADLYEWIEADTPPASDDAES